MKNSAQLIDGKLIAGQILSDLKGKIAKLNRSPSLVVILIGDDPASHRYVKKKKEACKKIGIGFHDYLCGGKFCPNATEKEILNIIDFLNCDESVDGILVQLPIPAKFSTQKIINRIDPKKDVDGFHPKNQNGQYSTSPLIRAINVILDYTKEDIKGKKVVIISKNPIFSDPLKQNLEKKKLEVKSVKPNENLKKETTIADILITVCGKPGLIKKSMIKPGAIIIDAGTTLVGKNKWLGDVDPTASEAAGWFTPVPGGVGPITVSCLLENTYELAKNK